MKISSNAEKEKRNYSEKSLKTQITHNNVSTFKKTPLINLFLSYKTRI